jgi:hypothetical protein
MAFAASREVYMIAFNSKYCSWLLRCAVLGVSLMFLAPAPAAAGVVLPYVKITLNDASQPAIGGTRVGFLRPTTPGSFDNNVYNFNGLQVKQVSNNGGTILDLQASKQHIAWIRVFFGQSLEWDVFSFDKGAANNISKSPEVIEDGLNVGGRNIVWTAFDAADDTYHVYRNQGANTVAITEGFMPGVFRLRGQPRASETDNIAWRESLSGSLGYFDANDDEIRIFVDDGLENSGHNISGHRVVWIARDFMGGGIPNRLKLYNGNTEQTTILAEEGGPLGTPVFAGNEDYDHPHVVWQGVVDPETFESVVWLTNVFSTEESIDFVDAVAPLAVAGVVPEVSDGKVAFIAGDIANNSSVVATYDINRDKVRIIASYPFDGTKFPGDVHISGPNLVWTVSEFLEEEPFFINSVVVAYRLDEYLKILLGL